MDWLLWSGYRRDDRRRAVINSNEIGLEVLFHGVSLAKAIVNVMVKHKRDRLVNAKHHGHTDHYQPNDATAIVNAIGTTHDCTREKGTMPMTEQTRG